MPAPPLQAPVTENRIRIAAPWRSIFDLAAGVEHWPEFLPHYRWVRLLEQRDEGRVVEMAARRGGWPVKWRALLQPRPEEKRVYFRHLGGPARGMRVYWELQETEGGTDVSIHHELSLEIPLIRTALGRWIVSEGFIRPIASRTLACMKRKAEGHS